MIQNLKPKESDTKIDDKHKRKGILILGTKQFWNQKEFWYLAQSCSDTIPNAKSDTKADTHKKKKGHLISQSQSNNQN